jgi:hypothetical protein
MRLSTESRYAIFAEISNEVPSFSPVVAEPKGSGTAAEATLGFRPEISAAIFPRSGTRKARIISTAQF